MTHTSRRRLIGSIGSGLIVALAGCSGGSLNGTESSESGSGGVESSVFDGLAFDGYTLNISLATTDGFDQVVAFFDGETYAKTDVTPSAGQVSLDFSGYTPGEYRFTAINSEEDSVTAEVTTTFEPKVEIVDWQSATEAGEYTPENKVTVASPVITLENTGNAPDELKWFGYTAEEVVPEWVSPDANSNTTSLQGIRHPDVQESRGEPPSLKSGAESPFIIQPESTRVFIELKSILVEGLRKPFSLTEDTKGWAVQEGTTRDVTVWAETKYSGRKSQTRTVTIENLAAVDNLDDQPESASIVTSSPVTPTESK